MDAHAPGPSTLAELARLATELDLPEIATEATALAARVIERRFFVTCVGQFKRGKSSLINALVGSPLLPTGIAPVTTVVTVLRHGEAPAARVALPDGWIDVEPTSIAAYVAERENPGNVKHVIAVEVFVPCDLLRDGLCLVDTPGIGSAIAANTAATKEFIPQIDAALIVLGTDPPISADELGLVEHLGHELSTLIVVLNKADRFSEAEREEARVFTERTLRERLGRDPGPILQVSAIEALESDTPGRDWNALRDGLRHLAVASRDHLVLAAERRGARVLGGRLLQQADEALGALLRPLEESEQRIARLQHCADTAEQSLQDLRALMHATRQRLSERFRAHHAAFLASALPTAIIDLARRLEHLDLPRAQYRRRAFEEAQASFRDTLERWRTQEQPMAEGLYREGAQRFVELANGVLRDLVRSAAVDVSLPTITDEAGFRVKGHLYYTDLMRLTGRSPLRWLLDRIRSPERARQAAQRDAAAYFEYVFATNASRITNDLDEQVRESQHRLEAEIRHHLGRMIEAAQHALANAQAHRALGANAAASEIERLRRARARITSWLPPERPHD